MPADTADIAALTAELAAQSSTARFRPRARAVACALLGDLGDRERAAWFELVAGEFLASVREFYPLARALAQVAHAAACVAERRASVPADLPAPYWSTWPHIGEPPALVLEFGPVPCARQPAWDARRYDTRAWYAMVELLTHMTHIGDFATLDLHPIPGVDPAIIAEPRATLDFRATRHQRPTMGLCVAMLTLRQLAYQYASEFDEHAIAAWLFAIVTGRPPRHRAIAPDWATAAMAQDLANLEPAALVVACQTAAVDLDRRYAAC